MIIKHIKTIRIIVGACGIHQPAYGDKTSLRHVALSKYHLPCVGLGLIRVVIKDTVLFSKKKELRKINCRHFVFFICSQPNGGFSPPGPSVFSGIDY